MRYYPEPDELHELEERLVQPWQAELLKLNPSYCSWGNFEDYMIGKDKGWAESQEVETWEERYGLDDLNEVVNFYFRVSRSSHNCPHCNDTGLNPASQRISDTFYDFEEIGGRWCDKITADEVYALVKSGRLQDFMPDKKWYHFDEEVNSWQFLDRSLEKAAWVNCKEPDMPLLSEVNEANSRHSTRRGFSSHDGINRSILIRTRCQRLGIWGECEHCDGNAYIYDEDFSRVSLQLWVLHPRKGCSKGLYIKNIEQSELPEVFAYLKEAAARNAERFSKIP